MTELIPLKFNKNTPSVLKDKNNINNWPVVYIIYNKKEAYIGETLNASVRSYQHFSNNEKQKLNKMIIIKDEMFNKSVTLELESFLIEYMSADNKFKLQNGNNGLHNHNYFQKEIYEPKLREIWLQLKSIGIVNNDLKRIATKNLFKYSPYKTLTTDQYLIINKIIKDLSDFTVKKESATFLVKGGAGTGKTILATYLVKLIKDAKYATEFEIENDPIEKLLQKIVSLYDDGKDLKIGLVIPTDNFRYTLKKVFSEIKGLNSKMVLSPNEVAKSEEDYDILVVDEAHRLRRRKNITQYKIFDRNNKRLNLTNNCTELDWILSKSKYQIIFYDEKQSIKPTDVRKEDFKKLAERYNYNEYKLSVQLRCFAGGSEYIDYVDAIFSDKPPKDKIDFEKYDLKIFDNVNDMVKAIKEKNKKHQLCRNVAGFAWPWNTKSKNKTVKENKKYDIEINEYKYIWNSSTKDWINSPNAINEIGSIHTTQGYDLNYTGLIIGNELKYDNNKKRFIVDRNNYYDIKGKNGTTDEQLLEYILNIYCTMMKREMLGTYIYVCNDELKKYLSKYIGK